MEEQKSRSIQKQLPEVFCKKMSSKNFCKFTAKHLCRTLFLINLQALRLEQQEQQEHLKNIRERSLLSQMIGITRIFSSLKKIIES